MDKITSIPTARLETLRSPVTDERHTAARSYIDRYANHAEDRALCEAIIANWDATPESGTYPDLSEPSGFVIEAILRGEVVVAGI